MPRSTPFDVATGDRQVVRAARELSKDRIVEEKQDEQPKLIVMKVAVAGLVTVAADFAQLIE